MGDTLVVPAKKTDRIPLRRLHAGLAELRQRVEDLEDLRKLNEAIERNAGRKLTPWAQAKKELGLDDRRMNRQWTPIRGRSAAFMPLQRPSLPHAASVFRPSNVVC
jgi:hypothetical protein